MQRDKLLGLLAGAGKSPATNARNRWDLRKPLSVNEQVARELGVPVSQLEDQDFRYQNNFASQDFNSIPKPKMPAPMNVPAQSGYSQAEKDAMMSQYHARDRMQAQDRQDAIDLKNFRLNQGNQTLQTPQAPQRDSDGFSFSGLMDSAGGMLSGLRKGAHNLFNDPTRMALLQGGLTAMNPNSYYDKDGFYSTAGGLNRALGTAGNTYRNISTPIEPSFKDRQALMHKNKMAQIGLSNTGRVPSLQQAYNTAVAQGYKGTLLDYQIMLKQAGRAITNINMPGETHGSKKFDESVGKGIGEYMLSGGATDSMKQMAQLQDVSNDLNAIAEGKSDKNLTGAILGFWPKGIRAFWNQESVNTQDLVEEVVQRNLKAILGAQFAKTEGEQLIERAYNPKLEESINAPRIARLLQQMKIAHEQKQAMVKHFMKFKTMDGFAGHIPTMEDFTKLNFDNPNANSQKPMGSGLDSKSEERRQQLLKKYPDMNQGAN